MNNTNSNQNKNFISSKHDVILDDLTLLEKINLLDELKYFQKKYSFEVKILANDKFIIPEYKIELINKSNCKLHSFPILLLGNKCDNKNRQVTRDEAEIYALKNSMIYEEVSCKNGDNIESSFSKIVKDIYTRMNKQVLGPGIKRHFSQNSNCDYDKILVKRKCPSNTCCVIV